MRLVDAMPTLGLVVAPWQYGMSLLIPKVHLFLKFIAIIKDFLFYSHDPHM